MIVQKIGLYLLQKRYHAIVVVFLCALLSLVGVPTSPIAAIVIGLVTLHKGVQEGLILVAWMLLPGIVMAFYGDFWFLIMDGLGKGLVVWMMACVLSRHDSWAAALQAVSLFGVVIVILLHLLMPDIRNFWLQNFTLFFGQGITPEEAGIPPGQMTAMAAQVTALMEAMSYYFTGFLLAIGFALNTLWLLIARLWQAKLFNPGGLGREWIRLRLSYVSSIGLLVMVGLAIVGFAWAQDTLPVLCLPFIFAGLSVIHAILPEKKQIRIPLLIVLYLGLFFVAQAVVIVLTLLAMTDSWFNFRKLSTQSY